MVNLKIHFSPCCFDNKDIWTNLLSSLEEAVKDKSDRHLCMSKQSKKFGKRYKILFEQPLRQKVVSSFWGNMKQGKIRRGIFSFVLN
jgi:hypothetical protein